MPGSRCGSDGDAPVASSGVAASSADSHVAAVGTQLRAGTGDAGSAMTSLSHTNADMKAEQARMHAERKRVAAELKNAQQRKRHMRTKARQVSNEDWLAVLLLRQERTS